MRNTIGLPEIQAAYDQAQRVWNGLKSEASAKSHLVETMGMNPASASDYIRNLSQMLRGIEYHRTLNLVATRYYFDQILKDFGASALEKAIISTDAHLDYYESLPNGASRPSFRRLCEEYRALLKETKEKAIGNLSQTHVDFQESISRSLEDSSKARQQRLSLAETKPTKFQATTTVYRRNPDVVAERLFMANGFCEACGNEAPFFRDDGSPFLEVHHIIPLSENGSDVVENTLALCPNCHREAHYGEKRMRFRLQSLA